MPDDPRGALIARLQERLEERRRSGLYRRELLEELDAYGREVAPALVPSPDHVSPLRPMAERIASLGFDLRYETTSRVPGGGVLHGAVAKLHSRLAHRLTVQLNLFADAVTSAVDGLVTALENPTAHDHFDVESHLASLRSRVNALDAAARLGTSTDIVARLERLEAAERARDFRPFFSNTAFEDAFRGSQDALVDHYAPLADRLSGPVLEIGCGQGSLLRLLGERGVEARGIELDAELAQRAAADGLPVEHGDGLAALGAVPDGTLGAVVLLQVVEHLSAQQLCDLVLLASTKLRPGGLFVAETVNPGSIYVFAHALYLDPTHTTPVHPLYLRFLCEQARFASVEVELASPVPDEERLPTDGGELADRMNALLFAPQDYLLLAQR